MYTYMIYVAYMNVLVVPRPHEPRLCEFEVCFPSVLCGFCLADFVAELGGHMYMYGYIYI